MSYEAVGEIVRGHGGHVFNSGRRPIWVRRPLMGLGTWADLTNSANFYLIPATIGLLGLYVFAKLFGFFGKSE